MSVLTYLIRCFRCDYNEVIQELLTYMKYSSQKNNKEGKEEKKATYFKVGQLILYLHLKILIFFSTLAIHEQLNCLIYLVRKDR